MTRVCFCVSCTMCAGFIAQHHAVGGSPIDNLLAHIADPYHVTFATNGVSVPHYTEFP